MLQLLCQTRSFLLYRAWGVEGRGCGMLKLSAHRAMQQLANKDEFCFVWQRFSVHYFPLCPARIPALSSCLSCKDTLSGPDSSSPAHTVRMAHAHFTCVHTPHPPLTLLHMWGTYVVICLTTTPFSTTPHTLLSHPLQYSHRSSFVKSVFPFFCPSPNLVETSHMSAVMLLLEKLTGTVNAVDFLRAKCVFARACMCACVSTRHLKQVLSYLGCGQSVCWPLSCFGEHVDIKRF